jgi:hypothetical protein
MTASQPNWQPISMLPTIANLINENLDETLVQLRDFKEAEHKPQIFDDEIINRALKIYNAQLEDHWLFERQLELWSNEKLTTEQRTEVDNFKQRLPKIKEAYEAILALLNKMKDYTIDKILAMDDAELGLKVLMGQMPGTFHK